MQHPRSGTYHLLQILPVHCVLLHQPPVIDSPLDRDQQLILFERLEQIVIGALAHGGDGRPHILAGVTTPREYPVVVGASAPSDRSIHIGHGQIRQHQIIGRILHDVRDGIVAPLDSTVEYSAFSSMPSMSTRQCLGSSTTRTRAGCVRFPYSPGIRSSRKAPFRF